MYEQGFTMEQIATQFGVTHKTISKDLENCTEGTNQTRAKTASNPKGAGRPKGSRKQGETQKQRSVNATPDDWDRFKQKAEAEGKSAAEKLGEIVAGPEINRSELSLTAQQKLDAAIRQYEAKLAESFAAAVDEKVRKKIDEIILPHWKEKIATADKLFKHRRGAMSKETFNTIRRALHPDSRASISDQKLGEAFDTFMSLEKFLLDEKDSPTDLSGLPETLAEWDAAKRRASKASKARHAAGHSAVRPR
jgi:hypothetical protein